MRASSANEGNYHTFGRSVIGVRSDEEAPVAGGDLCHLIPAPAGEDHRRKGSGCAETHQEEHDTEHLAHRHRYGQPEKPDALGVRCGGADAVLLVASKLAVGLDELFVDLEGEGRLVAIPQSRFADPAAQ